MLLGTPRRSLAFDKRVAKHTGMYLEQVRSKSNGEKENSKWKIWEPYPIQKKLLDCRADVIGFGGSGGGSKSTSLIFAAYLNHKKSLLLRKTYPNLKEIIERSREMFTGSGASYNSIEKLWRFPDGKLIEFGAVQYIQDRENYRGREHDALLIDEVTELPGGLETLQFMSGWVRSPNPHQHCATICTFNPPSTPESQWVREFWGPWIDPDHPDPADDGEVRWFAMIDGVDTKVEDGTPFLHDEELLIPKSRTFIRATLDDNPALANSGYRSTLQSLPEPLRSQLLYGDMSIRLDDDPWQAIPSEWVEKAFQRWEENGGKDFPQTSMGVDVARGGKDETILAKRYRNWYAPLLTFPGAATPNGPMVATQIMEHVEDDSEVNIDVVGVGSSVYDSAEGLCNAYPISGGEFSDALDSSGNLAFFNKRSEIIWKMREALDPEFGDNIALPRDNKLKADLCSSRWEVRPPTDKQSKLKEIKGQIKIESKDETKKRIGRSPDRGDAVCYANYKRPLPKEAGGSFSTQQPSQNRQPQPNRDNFGRRR